MNDSVLLPYDNTVTGTCPLCSRICVAARVLTKSADDLSKLVCVFGANIASVMAVKA